MPEKKKIGRDFPLAPTPQPNGSGTYVAINGRVGRTHGINGPYESMDTTGFSKGKKEFELNSSVSGYKTSTSKIQRKDVPAKIEEFKKGATRSLIQKK